MAFNIECNLNYIEKVSIFENETHFLFIGNSYIRKEYSLFSIRKLFFQKNQIQELNKIPLSELLSEDKKIYSKLEITNYLKELEKKSPVKCNELDLYGIFGFVKFFLGYYIILINQQKSIGKINKHIINKIEKLRYIPLFFSKEIKNEKEYNLELKYLSIFQSMDCLNQMYYSYSYNLTKTLQRNYIENLKKEIITKSLKTKKKNSSNSNKKKEKNPLKEVTSDYFLFNYYHQKEFYPILKNKNWCLFIIFGFFCQNCTEIYGFRFLITVIARRNRNYAGTRYLKRGINDDGNVANDVETEQILEEISTSCSDFPIISSFVHIRGSVPIYWYQEQNSILPKPQINLNYSDIKFDATKRHFENIFKRYGKPCLVCNLTKKHEKKKRQETLLNEWYENALNYINENLNDDEKIIYNHYDLKILRKDPKFYKKYCDESCKFIRKTNLFCFIPYNVNTYMLSLQNGVIRSNCVDCLDRTNVYQQIIGTAVMIIQLRYCKIKCVEPENEYDNIYGILTQLYKKMGNELSNQYGGSLAHKQNIEDEKQSKINKFVGKVYEFVNTTKRYFNNTYNDQKKQNAYNVFLGKYKINRNKYKNQIEILDMINDISLHRKRIIDDIDINWNKNAIDFYISHNLLCDIDDKINKIHTITTKKELFELGKEFNLDIIEKLDIKKYIKKLPILTNNQVEDIYDFATNSVSNTFDYLFRIDKYIKYKKMHPTQYIDQLLFVNHNLLELDLGSKITYFPSTNYDDYKKDGNVWSIYNSKNETNAVIVYDETIQQGINIGNNNNNKKDNIELIEIKNKKKPLPELNYNYLNICSFPLEKNVKNNILNFCNFNNNELFNENNKYTYFHKLDNLNKFTVFDFSNDKYIYEKDNNDFYKDMENKTNIIKLINEMNDDNNENEENELETILFDWSDINIEKKENNSNIIITEFSTNTHIKIENEYIK